MKMSSNELSSLSSLTETITNNNNNNNTNGKLTIQDIANKQTEEQLKTQRIESNALEHTIFVLGSKGVGKTTIINNFLERNDGCVKPTLALEYAYGRRTNSSHGVLQKQICNVWELGTLINSYQLIDIPIKSHGIEYFTAVIVLDIAQPECLWADLDTAINCLKQSIKRNCTQLEIDKLTEKSKERIGLMHPDLNTLELLPFPVLIIGGNYDRFQDLDPEIKKHVCRCLRSIAHTIGSALIFYTQKNQLLTKIIRDTFNYFGFDMTAQTNPMFRRTQSTAIIDYNGPVNIWYGKDSWEQIGVTPTNSERIGLQYSTHIPQADNTATAVIIGNEQKSPMAIQKLPNDPAKDPGFRESIIDEMRAQKDDELERFIRDSELRGQFQSIIT